MQKSIRTPLCGDRIGKATHNWLATVTRVTRQDPFGLLSGAFKQVQREAACGCKQSCSVTELDLQWQQSP
eukprot:2529723-Amphidinium_carterae.1